MVISIHGEVRSVDHGHLWVILGWCDVMDDKKHDGVRQAAALSFCSHDTSCTQSGQVSKCAKQGKGSYFSFIFKFISTMRRNGRWWKKPGWRAPKPASRREENNVLPLCFNDNVCRRTFEQLLSTDQQAHLKGGGGVEGGVSAHNKNHLYVGVNNEWVCWAEHSIIK